MERPISILPLLTYRLRWYALSTARLLLRRWQAVTLIVGLSASAGTSALGNMETLAYPLLALLDPDHGVFSRSSHLLALLAVASLWAGMQRVQIEGGAFMGYVGSLPFAPRQLRRIDIAVLLLADGPLLFLVGGALASTLVHQAQAAHALLICNVMLLALVTQVAVLERRLDNLPLVAVTCCIMAYSFDSSAGPAIGLLVALAAALALWLGPRQRKQRRTIHSNAQVTTAPVQSRRSLFDGTGALQLSFFILYRERRNEAIGKALLASGIVAAAWGFVQIFERDARSLPTILIAQGFITLAISGMFRYLHMTHRASTGFTGALPLPLNWWRPFDLMAVTAFSLPFLAGLAACACIIGVATPGQAATAVLSYLLLLCGLSLPHLYTDRHAVVLGTTVTGLWIAATIACLT